MIKGSFILIISLALLSPLPFVSPWYESAHAQVNKSTTGARDPYMPKFCPVRALFNTDAAQIHKGFVQLVRCSI